MNLFDPQRPEASPGRKAILLDGSAIPALTVIPLPNGDVEVVVNLRNYKASGRSYSQFRKEMTPVVLAAFINSYVEDPEEALQWAFAWSPQATEDMRAAPSATAHAWTEAMDIL